MQLPTHCDVLIVGAGPTGLMLANQLARRGIDALIIDRHAGPARETRALGVQARTMEIYAQLGLDEPALELGKRATGANLWARGRRTARIPLGDIGQGLSPFPFLLILGQDDNERLLGDALRRQGRDVHWSTELVGLEQRAGGVSAELSQPDGSKRTISASWVGGCDGARSAVRELNGIAFPGAPYQHVFFVADTIVTGPMVPDELNVFLLADGFHLFFPMRGQDHWRVVGILPPELRDRDDVDFEEVAPSVRSHVGSALEFRECHWFSTYRIHHRRAERFRKGRCFLLGDAAHIHSPVGAQGMNTGLQDAYNLAWKLALVVSGRAGEPLLNSFAAEREPVAERLLQTTDRGFAFIVSDGWSGRLLRTRVLARVAALAMRFDPARKLAFRTISQTGIQYRASPLSQDLPGLPEHAPRGGDRFPWMKLRIAADAPDEDLYARLDGSRFNLILFGQPAPAAPAALAGLMKIHQITSDGANGPVLAREHIPAVSYFLLRPDGYIGLAGNRADATALHRYCGERLAIVPDR
jgi:2-polyprenyl-6-methoxyphenol hydroxylase-like FAD-dependent oxidoreductase